MHAMPDSGATGERPSICVVGDTGVGKRTLIERLPGVSIVGKDAQILLDTKYYTASASIELYGGSQRQLPTEQEAEALIIVFDGTRESSFEYVKRWAGGETGRSAEIKLCIANKIDKVASDETNARPRWLVGAGEWCTRELFEFIQVSAAAPELDATLTLDGEAQGVRRVLAALQAHMWPGLSLKDTSLGDGVPARVGEVAPGTPPDRQREDGAAAALAGTDSLASPISDGKQGAAAERTDEEVERDMDQLERMMNEVAGARGRLRDLPDADRRAAAESLTMSLLSKLGLDEEFTESDDE